MKLDNANVLGALQIYKDWLRRGGKKILFLPRLKKGLKMSNVIKVCFCLYVPACM